MLNKVVSVSEELLKIIMVLLLALMTIAMFYQVIARYALGVGAAWTEETARFACIWLVYIGAAVCALRGEHVSVTLIDQIMKGETQAYVLKLFRNLCSMAFFIVVSVIGFQMLPILSRQTSPNMRIPMNIVYIVIPVSCALAVIYLIVNSAERSAREENK